jgi:predicted transposase YbfD/YdcC
MATKRVPQPEAIQRLFVHFGEFEDPRIERTRRHELLHVIVMSLCGAICGADGWDALADFAKAKEEWFKTFLDLPNGTPSADTFRRVLSALEPREFETCLRQWVNDVAANFRDEVIAIDGKSLRGAVERAGSTTPLHLLQVWAVEQRLVLGQRAVEGGASGETAAIPAMLKLLSIEGAVVTMDANGCTAATTIAAREAKADYVLALKGNRGPQYKHVREVFRGKDLKSIASTSTWNEGHGRTEARVIHALAAEGWTWPGWQDVKTFVMIERSRATLQSESEETHYFLSSLPPDAARLGEIVRAHWGIENNLNWMMDVAFGEDRQRIRDKRGAENFALINRLALMLVRNEKTMKAGAPRKRKRAGWDDTYLSLVLTRGLEPAS